MPGLAIEDTEASHRKVLLAVGMLMRRLRVLLDASIYLGDLGLVVPVMVLIGSALSNLRQNH